MRALVFAGLAAGLVGAVVVLGAIAAEPREAMYAWHFALMFGTTTAVGALFLLMFGHAANANWFLVVRRPVEHVVGTLPLMAVLFLPTLLFPQYVFPWADDGTGLSHHAEEIVLQKRAYLNETAFTWRTLGSLLALLATGELLRFWSRRQDLAEDATARLRYGHWMRALSAVAFPLLGLIVTISFVDWIMSLQPTWYSTMFGVAVLAGGFVGAVGLLAVTIVFAGRHDWLEGLQVGHRHATGRVLFASLCFWGYVNFVQYLIIWIADLPEEVQFFLRRQQAGWQWLGVAVVLGHLVIPFFLLLSRRLKEVPATLAFLGAWMLVFHAVAVFYLVIPAHRPELRLHWTDPFALLMVLGFGLALTVLRSRRMAPEPIGDAGLERARSYLAP